MADKRLQVDIDAVLFERLKKNADKMGLRFWAYIEHVLRLGLDSKAAKEGAAK